MTRTSRILIALSFSFVFFAAVVSSLSLTRRPNRSVVQRKSDCNYEFLAPNLVGQDFNKISSDYNVVQIKKDCSEEFSAGCIISQSPRFGEKCREDTTIMAVVSEGSRFAELPDVRGRAIGEASIKISNAGFVPRAMVIPSEGEEGVVLGYYGISYKKGLKLEKSKEIILEVSG